MGSGRIAIIRSLVMCIAPNAMSCATEFVQCPGVLGSQNFETG